MNWKAFLIVLTTFAAAYLILPMEEKPFFKKGEFLEGYKINLGIDLRGGAELRYRLIVDDEHKGQVKAMTEKARSIFERRINIKGLTEPNITIQGEDTIVVQLAGVDSSSLPGYKEIFNKVGSLMLKEVADSTIHSQYQHPNTPVGYEWIENIERADKQSPYMNGKYILVKKEPIIDGTHIVSATTHPDSHPGGFVVSFALSNSGTLKFEEATSRLAEKGYISIILDGKLMSRPWVKSKIGGQGQIDGFGTEKAADDIATVLRSGSLPAPVKLESENFVGATLGQDSITRGLYASLVSIIIVALFMIVYYRGLGIISVVTLAQNLILILAIMAFFNATLTLPGIAGLVLTVGMAVDANILIYERMREEKAKGKTSSQSFEAGHERAFVTILDSNLTTLIAAIALYFFGAGPIRGFAITLSIGILMTMFTVLVCGKMILRGLIHGGKFGEFGMMRLFTSTNIGFTRRRYVWLALSGLAFIISFVLFFSTGDEKWGLDFKGGSIVTINFHDNHPIDTVRAKLTAWEKKIDEEVAKAKGAGTSAEAWESRRLPGVVIQPVVQFEESGKGKEAKTFQIRTTNPDSDNVRDGLRQAFVGMLPPEPFEKLPDSEIPSGPLEKFNKGTGFYFYVNKAEGFNQEKLIADLKAYLNTKGLVRSDPNRANTPLLSAEYKGDVPGNIAKFKFLITKDDADSVTRIQEFLLKKESGLPFVSDPFVGQGKISATVASELKSSTIEAMIVSWILMIIYVAFRFSSWKFGVAAVLALIHDAVISIGVVVLCGMIIPESWGLSFEFNVTSVAAILTIIGFSVNDTIVVFDRIRENLIYMRKETFPQVIDASVNQTLSRTVLTSFTAWMSVVVLYVFTIGSGAGLEGFAFPLIAGFIIGTYSSIYIASPILIEWFKGTRPVIAK